MEQEQQTVDRHAVLLEAGRAYCYPGFASSLRRYRRMTVLGWVVVAAGFLSLMIGWRDVTSHGMLDLLLSTLAMASGVGIVQQSVMTLESYVRTRGILVSAIPQAERGPAIDEALALMEEVETGGWQDAYAALKKLRALGTTHGIPVA